MINDKTESSATDRSEQILQLISFRIASTEYGIDILRVLEIIRPPHITQSPGAPDYVDGVITLHGRAIPIINVYRRFSLAEKAGDADSRIVIVDADGQTLGLAVDAVNEVLRVPPDKIEPFSGSAAGAEFISQTARLEEIPLYILDLSALVGVAVEFASELAARMAT